MRGCQIAFNAIIAKAHFACSNWFRAIVHCENVHWAKQSNLMYQCDDVSLQSSLACCDCFLCAMQGRAVCPIQSESNILQCFAMFHNVSQSFTMFHIVFQCFAMFCNVWQCFAMFYNVLQCFAMFCNVLQCFTMFCNVLQCFTMFYNVLQQFAFFWAIFGNIFNVNVVYSLAHIICV